MSGRNWTKGVVKSMRGVPKRTPIDSAMHEISLGYTIRDYISGQEVEATTFEDLRQAIAKILVEEKGYPKDQIRSKVAINFEIDSKVFEQSVDLVVSDENGTPVLVVMFCFGDIMTFHRQTVSAARLIPNGPARLALITDTKKADLLCAGTGEVLRSSGYHALPVWADIEILMQECPLFDPTPDHLSMEQRIFYAFSEMSGGCCTDECPT